MRYRFLRDDQFNNIFSFACLKIITFSQQSLNEYYINELVIDVKIVELDTSFKTLRLVFDLKLYCENY